MSGEDGKYIYIGKRRVGPGEPVFFIAEIGINHNGNPELARKLIDLAAECGADAVKFQKRKLSEVYDRGAIDDIFAQDKDVQFVLDWLKRCELSDEVFAELAEYAWSKGLEFLCSPWDRDSVDFLERLGVRAYKIASADMTNFPLLRYVSQTGKPLLVSTGMSDWQEIERTVEFLRQLGAPFALLHCQSTYPAAFKDINLRVMLRLMEFGVPVGYSGHERGIAVSTCAAALGACIIERHITLDRTMPGPDHAASLEPPGLQKQIRDIRIIEVALGHDRRSPSRGELLTRVSLGKSLVAARDIMAGEIITWDMLSARSPGTGVSPQRALELIGKPAPRDFKAGERFLEADITGQQPADIVAASPFPWGASVRFHDAEAIASSLSPDLLEFHLTDMDLDRGVPEMPQFRQALSTHCPEYYHGKLLDICSADEATRQWSVSVVKRAADVARRLAELFPQSPRPLLVVHPGAMSYEDFLADPAPLAAAFARSVEELSGISDLQIVYENLPPFPWYFGGQWYGNYFCSPEDIVSACTELGIYICFDTSHAQLWCNHAQCNLIDFFDAVRAWIRHVHVADASGVDGEGLQIGMGEVDFHQLLPRLVSLGLPLLMEVWLGHHSGGEGFVVAVSRLTEIAQRVGLSRGA